MTEEVKKRHGRTKEELAKIGAKTRFKAGKQQAEIARQGALASAAVRKERKTIREELEFLLEKKLKNNKGEDISTREAISTAMIGQAIKGNVKAFVAIRDTIGEKPIDEQKITGSLGVKKVFVTKEEQAEVEEHIADVIGDGR